MRYGSELTVLTVLAVLIEFTVPGGLVGCAGCLG
jgi:hypothetical protein